MTCSLDFEKASQYVRVRATAEQELTMLEHRFASHEVVARLTGLPVAAVRTIRNNLGIDATTTRRLARAEQAHAAFCMYLQGRTATGIGEAQGVSAAVVSQQIARFLRRVLKVRNESRAAHDWNTLRADMVGGRRSGLGADAGTAGGYQ